MTMVFFSFFFCSLCFFFFYLCFVWDKMHKEEEDKNKAFLGGVFC